MSDNTTNLMLGNDHPVAISPLGGSAVVTVKSGATVYWFNTSGVSPSRNLGTITVGTPATFTSQVWLRSASLSAVQVVTSPIVPVAGADQGVATLTAGTVTVSNTAVTATSQIVLTAQDNNTTGALRISSRIPNTSFTITSSNVGDTGLVAWERFEANT